MLLSRGCEAVESSENNNLKKVFSTRFGRSLALVRLRISRLFEQKTQSEATFIESYVPSHEVIPEEFSFIQATNPQCSMLFTEMIVDTTSSTA